MIRLKNCNFSFKHYEEIIKSAEELGYEFIFFTQSGRYDKEIIIRHDVDVDIEYALEMAKFENALGLKSSYFIILTSRIYNVFDKDIIKKIYKIKELGHDIGIHFDETSYDILNITDLENAVHKEKEIFNNYLDLDVSTISFHVPSSLILQNSIEIEGLINTYSDKFFRNYKYLSDSRMNWREGCICSKLNSCEHKKYQVVLHPVWWTNKGINSSRIKERFFIKRNHDLKTIWENEIRV